MRAALLLCAAVAAAQEHTHNTEAIVRALHLEPGQRIADVGAGQGAYTFPIAKIVGSTGKVYAVDIDEKNAIPKLRERIARDKTENVEVILGKPDDPLLPAAALDAVLIVNAYHEMEKYQSILEHVRESLKPGGRLLIVDSMPGRTRAQSRAIQMKNHMLDPDIVEADLRAAGFQVASRNDDIDGNPEMDHLRWMIIARIANPQPH